MKTNFLQTMLVVVTVAGLAGAASPARAQDSSAASAAAPQLSYGVSQIMQLEQAKVGDDTIIAYVKNSGNSYGLDANQIIYLRQQGVSDAVITTMLNQPKPAVAVATPATPASQPVVSTASPVSVPTATVAPTVTYVQTVPTTAYYDYQPYYYPSYAWYPPVVFSFGWGGGYRGGWGGGFHGGGFHGGGWHH